MSKLDGYKKGDCFEVVMRGVVLFEADKDGDLVVQMDGSELSGYILAKAASDPNFQITRIEPEIKVCDNVTWGNRQDAWEVVAIKGDTAILFNGNFALDLPIKDLVRA